MKQARIPTDQEFKRLITTILQTRFSARNKVMILLSYYAGLRVGEIATLKVGDVFGFNGQVKDFIQLSAKNTKSKEARIIFLNKRLKKEIAAFGNLVDKSLPRDHLLKTQKGTPFSPNTLCQLMKELYVQAGIDGASSHSGRRWFITKLAHSGVSAKVIMELAGHKNLTTTQTYIEVNDKMKREAVRLL